MPRHDGSNFDQLRGGRESSVVQSDPVNAESEVLRGVTPVISGLKIQTKLISLADQFARGAESGALRIVHLDLQFSAAPLRGSRKGADAEESQDSKKLFPSCHAVQTSRRWVSVA